MRCSCGGTLVGYDDRGSTLCTACRAITPAPAPPPAPTVPELLAFASGHPTGGGAIRRELGVSPVRYWQLLNRAIDTAEARELAPELVDRLRERRHRRHALRTGATA